MKFLFSIILFFCLPLNKTNRELFDDFHKIFEKGDFKAMDALLSDDFVGLNEEGKISFSRSEYIAYMQEWNHVFKTKWNVVSVEIKGNLISSIEYDTDMYNDYFYGGKKTTQYIYSFSKNRIKSIQTLNTESGIKGEIIFQERFDKFYNWVNSNYPSKIIYCTRYDKEAATEIKSLLQKYLLSFKS